MGLRWLCVERCFQPVYDSANPNACMMYEPDVIYTFPDEATKKVPRRYFDLIDDKPAAALEDAVEPAEDTEQPSGNFDDDQLPVESLFNMSDGIQAGLNAEGIHTVGDLRKLLMSKDGDKTLLESEHLAVGPARLAKFKRHLGLITDKEGK